LGRRIIPSMNELVEQIQEGESFNKSAEDPEEDEILSSSDDPIDPNSQNSLMKDEEEDPTAILDVSALLHSGKLSYSGGKSAGGVLPSVFDFDLGNLLVFDRQEQNDLENEAGIKNLTGRCVQELFEKVFNLRVTGSELGPLAKLPYPRTPIPREKPIPEVAPMTRWEKFAKEKGIKKRKRGRMVWDDTTESYKPRWGMDRVNDPKKTWILPDKPEELARYGAEDPFHLEQIKKKERTTKNTKLKVKNQRRALTVQSASLPPTLDITKNAPKRQKYSLEKAVELAQKSTASMGRFDKLHPDEPTIKYRSQSLPSRVPKELQVTNKIADRVIKKQQSLNLDKAVRAEMRHNPQEKSSKKKKNKKTT